MIELEESDSLVDMKFMTKDARFSKKYFYDQIKQGKLPKPIKLNRCSRWKLSDYLKWKESHSVGIIAGIAKKKEK